MKWYYNNAGTSEGPHDEAAMTVLADKGVVGGGTLVWNTELENWVETIAIRPPWWRPKVPSISPPVVEPPTKTGPPGTALPQRKTIPKAPTDESVVPQKEGGLLKRWFGGGKGKK